MSTPENILGLPQQPTKHTKASSRGYSLHEATRRLADIGLQVSRKRTRDLVALLLCHGARTWRASQPTVSLNLHVESPHGVACVKLRCRPNTQG